MNECYPRMKPAPLINVGGPGGVTPTASKNSSKDRFCPCHPSASPQKRTTQAKEAQVGHRDHSLFPLIEASESPVANCFLRVQTLA